ncbi:MAG: hypothetical protein IT548_08945 [Alphaproteobacteria bacterium]|nr:hypothetical protein [Alphaproteobacteria bacterium]
MRRRFILALILAILPFAVLTAGQAAWRLIRAYETASSDLIDGARASTVPEANVLAAAEGVLRGLENNRAVRAGSAACAYVLRGALDNSPYTNVSRLNAHGVVVCSARPVPANIKDRSGQPWWTAVSNRRSFMISEQHYGPLAQQNVLTAALPLFRSDGTFDGALALGIGVDVLGALMRERSMPNGTVAALLDAEGSVVSSSDEAVAQALFGRPIDLHGTGLLRGEDDQGNGWRFAIAEVRGDDLFIAFAQRETALFAWSYVDLAANVALPLLMAAFAFGAIWYSADRFVLRWIAYLQRVARAYGRGHFALRPEKGAADAPGEIQQLARAMGDMADNIRQRDRSLRAALDQRSLMLREIHHRVKNNLQIVGSLLQLEARRVHEPGARAALKITQTRINAIALAHRVLEEVDAQTVVNLRTLLTELAALLHDAFAEGLDAQPAIVRAPAVTVETDIAVPLSLWLVEQLAEIYRTAIERRVPLALQIEADDAVDAIDLKIRFDGALARSADSESSFAPAYVRQLRGAFTVYQEPGSPVLLVLRFPRRLGVTWKG